MANLSRGKDVLVPNEDISEQGSTSYQDISNSQKIDQKLQTWSIPKIKTKKVYKTSFFESKRDYVIETVEKGIQVKGSCMDLVIMDSDIVYQHQEYYGYLHLGLIQVAVKPLTRLRLDSPILICLRDRRLKKFHDSLLAVLESNLQSGPAYFNYFPNYTISLEDGWADKFLALDIKVPSDKFTEGTLPMSIRYRFCFKVCKMPFGTRALRQSPINETEIIEVNAQDSCKETRKRLKHGQIAFPEEWLQERHSPPEPQRGFSVIFH